MSLLNKIHNAVTGDGKYKKYYPLYEMVDTFLLSPKETSSGAPHVRDAIDLKRVMIIVVFALIPCFYMAMWNTGYQANSALAAMGLDAGTGWRWSVMKLFGLAADPTSYSANIILGALYFFPIYIVCNIAGGFWETLFAIVRKHEINEGFLVTGSLIPLIVPPQIPLWQVALATSFGVVIGKEIFGGTGKNVFNPALLARAFLFFAYPAAISGNGVWVAVDGVSGATPLALAAEGGINAVMAKYSWWDCFIGTIPGSIGETSTLACLIGAAVLLFTGIASWRIMSAILVGSIATAIVCNAVGGVTNPMVQISPLWHLVMGGLAFGAVYMATDPVSSSMTPKGQYFYGALIGIMIILIRTFNPAYPEGVMLAILFGNALAPTIDYFVMRANIKRRKVRSV
ncbi:NADH:ubiquinone reductase (Na(+)-transporting) subunit B [Pseudodesulfovibrio cashew]|uniref:Na(+)-translocating NADH-quinone reductase subunit B n=1 Tax=Pseudodesulfovibrio cashew TaxID=2678688 RepID=A0A6I6JCD5_9BACT|nr:NADH:ubiquinone reductase (Na(+)-transporting) subunit B [Pseudodesulfovibrio cashew]QGY40446.1 NADH:ubiquinone reductase (Na(+)-transporting) subunit B [Pseudodesulfovibrio cashew]